MELINATLTYSILSKLSWLPFIKLQILILILQWNKETYETYLTKSKCQILKA